MSRVKRKKMVSRDNPGLSLSRQCSLVSINRSSFYYRLKGQSKANLALMEQIDKIVHEVPVLWFAPDDAAVAPRWR